MSWKQGRYLRTHTLSHLVTHPLTASAHILSHLLTLTAPPPPSQSPLHALLSANPQDGMGKPEAMGSFAK